MATSSCTANTASNSGLSRINDEFLRIVMVGKTGAGKSATGNTILGRECFESKLSGTSLTVDCSKGRAEVDGQKVAVIDTPGLFDTRVDKEEKQTVLMIQEIFGEAADKYSMVLFTHGDQLEDTTTEEFLGECPDLQELVAKCNGQYHVFNNKVKDRSQVIELLQKIREICKKNTGSHYTNEMFPQAERAVEEKKQQILRENEEQRQREQEELQKKYEEKLREEMKKLDKKLQIEREKERKEREAEMKKVREEKEREIENMRRQLVEANERQLREERVRLQNKHESEAREKAEKSNPFYKMGQGFKRMFCAAVDGAVGIAGGVVEVVGGVSDAAVGGAASVGGKFMSFFS